MSTKRKEKNYSPDLSLDVDSGELTGNYKTIAWMIHSGVLQAKEVIPKFNKNLKAKIEKELVKLKKTS